MPKAKNTVLSPAVNIYDIQTIFANNIDGSTGDINIKKKISYTQMTQLINGIADQVISESGLYLFLYDFAFWANIFEAYSDLKESMSFEEIEQLIYETNIKEVLINSIDRYQFDTIRDSVYKIIEYKKLELYTKSDFNDIAPDIKNLLGKFETITDMVNALLEKVNSNTNMGDPETMGLAMSNLAKLTNISEKDILNALIEQSGVTKGKGGRKPKSGGKSKGNVTNLVQFRGQQVLEGEEVADGIPVIEE